MGKVHSSGSSCSNSWCCCSEKKAVDLLSTGHNISLISDTLSSNAIIYCETKYNNITQATTPRLETKYNSRLQHKFYICLFFLIVLLLLSCQRRFVSLFSVFAPNIISVNGQIRVLEPEALGQSLGLTIPGRKTLVGSTAAFGAPTYGEVIVGKVYYGGTSGGGTPFSNFHCTNDYCMNNKLFPKTKGELDNQSGSLARIFLLDRGYCTFVTKVKVAESCGADAVIIVDGANIASHTFNGNSTNGPWTREDVQHVIMADDSHGHQVEIPSVLICAADGNMIKASISSGDVILELEWSLPLQWPVYMNHWTDLSQSIGVQFLHDFAPYAKTLAGHIFSNINYLLLEIPNDTRQFCLSDNDLVVFGSPEINGSTVHGTQFCSLQPSIHSVFGSGAAATFTSNAHIKGRDIVLETIRQLCIYSATASKDSTIPNSLYSDVFWDYIRRYWDDDSAVGCKYGFEKFENSNLTTCSSAIAHDILSSWDLEKYYKCIHGSQGFELLNQTKNNRAWTALAIQINGARLSGRLDAEIVLSAVCSACKDPVTNKPRASQCESLLIKSHAAEAPWLPYAGIQWPSIFVVILFMSIIISLVLYLYQRRVRDGLRNSLRQEVMTEVKTQMEEYYQLDDADFRRSSTPQTPLVI